MEYITGMDTRIGFPNEHLAGDSDDEVTSPLFATAVGLVMDGLRRQEKKKLESISEAVKAADQSMQNIEQEQTIEQPKKERKSFLDKLTERVKDFLDNAE